MAVMERARSSRRPLEVFTLPVHLTPVRTRVRWADGPGDVPGFDWTQAVPPLGDPEDFLGGLDEVSPDLSSPSVLGFYSPDTLVYPRLVRHPSLWLEDRPSRGGVSRSAPLRAISALKRVYRAARKDHRPCDKGSPTRRAIEEAAQEAGLLANFSVGWVPVAVGLDDLATLRSFYDDNLFSWIGAAYYVQTLTRALDLTAERLGKEEVLSELEQGWGGEKGLVSQAGGFDRDCARAWEMRDLGFKTAKERFSKIASRTGSSGLDFGGYREVLRKRFALLALIERVVLPEGFGVEHAGGVVDGMRRLQGARKGGPETEEVSASQLECLDGPFPLVPRVSASLYRAYLSILDLALIGITTTLVRACRYCGEPIVGRRRDAKFCDNKCRVAFFRSRRGLHPEEDSFLDI